MTAESMDWKYITLAGAVGFLIGCAAARGYYDIMYRKLLKANLDTLAANISLYKKIMAVYLDPVFDMVVKRSTDGKPDKI